MGSFPLVPLGSGFSLFFSGFVITWSYNPELPIANFYWRRTARIYPLHLLTTLLMVALSAAMMMPLHLRGAAFSLLLIQSWFSDVWRVGGNSVSWSLSCELFFYACFPFIVSPLTRADVRISIVAAVAVFALMGLYIVAYAGLSKLHLDINFASPYTNPAYRIGEFSIGVITAHTVRCGPRDIDVVESNNLSHTLHQSRVHTMGFCERPVAPYEYNLVVLGLQFVWHSADCVAFHK